MDSSPVWLIFLHWTPLNSTDETFLTEETWNDCPFKSEFPCIVRVFVLILGNIKMFPILNMNKSLSRVSDWIPQYSAHSPRASFFNYTLTAPELLWAGCPDDRGNLYRSPTPPFPCSLLGLVGHVIPLARWPFPSLQVIPQMFRLIPLCLLATANSIIQ